MTDALDRARPLIPKLERALRHHRQRVFDARGDAHARTLRRLKRTTTFRCLCRDNDDRASERAGDRLAAMGY